MISKFIRKLFLIIFRPTTKKSEDYLSNLYNVPKKFKNRVNIEAIIEKEYFIK